MADELHVIRYTDRPSSFLARAELWQTAWEPDPASADGHRYQSGLREAVTFDSFKDAEEFAKVLGLYYPVKAVTFVATEKT